MILYHIEFTDGSNPYVGFSNDLDKWRVNYLISPVPGPDGFYRATPAKQKVYRSKIIRRRDKYGCYHYEYDLGDKTLHFETYDKLTNLEALQRFYDEYRDLLLM